MAVFKGDIVELEVGKQDFDRGMEGACMKTNVCHDNSFKSGNIIVGITTPLAVVKVNIGPGGGVKVHRVLVVVDKVARIKQGIGDFTLGKPPWMLLVDEVMIPNTQIVVVTLANTGIISETDAVGP